MKLAGYARQRGSNISFSMDSSAFAISDSAGIIHIYDTASGEERVTLSYDAGGDEAPEVTRLAFSADGQHLISIINGTLVIRGLP